MQMILVKDDSKSMTRSALWNVFSYYSIDTPAFLTAFDAFVTEHVGKYLTLSREIGGDVYKHVSPPLHLFLFHSSLCLLCYLLNDVFHCSLSLLSLIIFCRV